MAIDEHWDIIEEGVDAINEYKYEHAYEPLILTNISPENRNFDYANFFLSDFSLSDFSNASFRSCNLTFTKFFNTNISNTDFSHSSLYGANLSYANLSDAKLNNVNLSNAILFSTELSEVDFTNSTFYATTIANCNIFNCIGLNKTKHRGPSSIGIDTLIQTYKSCETLSDELNNFFINAGIPKELLDALPDIISETKYYSCFISYGEPDKTFATNLYDSLKRRGVPCWIYSMDYTVGEKTWKEIKQKLRKSDKMIILCSSGSLIRDGVKKEIEEQIDDNPEKIIPISLDNIWQQEGFDIKRGNSDLKQFLTHRNYLDFTDRKITNDKLEKLLKVLEFNPSP